jgi:putative addiction module component (TIGR02574 family)
MTQLGIDRLSTEDRMRLVEEILESLDADREPPPLTEAQRQELDRRIALLEADPSRGTPWEEVEARILAKLKQ